MHEPVLLLLQYCSVPQQLECSGTVMGSASIILGEKRTFKPLAVGLHRLLESNELA